MAGRLAGGGGWRAAQSSGKRGLLRPESNRDNGNKAVVQRVRFIFSDV